MCAKIVPIGLITWEELKKVDFRHFENLRRKKKVVGGNGRGLYQEIQHYSLNKLIQLVRVGF